MIFQVTTFWTKVLTAEEKARLVQNIAGHLKNVTEFIQQRAVREGVGEGENVEGVDEGRAGGRRE